MEVLNSISDIESKIMDFAKSEILSDLGTNRNQLLEYTVVAIVAKYLNPHQFEERIEKLLGVPDYESLTLLTAGETRNFCIDYFVLIEKWMEDIKLRRKETPNLYRISVNYNLDDLIDLY